MTILDTFYTLFKADTKDLDKGLEESKRKAQGLADFLGNTDLAGAKLGATLTDLAVKAGALLGVGLSAQALWGSVSEVAAENFQLAKLAERFNTTADAVDEFIDAGELLGVSNETTIASLTALDRALQDTGLGMGRAKKVFEELGIAVEDANGKLKPVTTVMGELQEKIAKLDKGTQIRIMERLGLDPALLQIFNADLGALQKRMADIDRATGFDLEKAIRRSQDFTKAHKEMKVEVASLQMYLGKLKDAFAINSLPWFTKAIQTATEWLNKLFRFVLDNQQLVKGALIGIGGAITAVLLPAAIRGAIAVGLMVAPFLLVGAAITALIALFALAYDDITNFIEGNDSLIGQIFEKYPVVREIVESIGDVFKWMAGVVVEALETVARIWASTWEGMYQVVKGIGDLITGIFTYWIDLIGQFLDKFGGISNIAKNIGGFFNKLSGSAGMGVPAVPGLMMGQQQLALAGATPLASQTSNSIVGPKTSNKQTTVKVDNVNVQTQATDAAGISKSIGDTLGAQMRQTASNYDDGVAI